VDRGLSLPAACHLLRDKYRSQERLWASYGDYDREQFQRSCAAHGVEYPFGSGHINVKSLFAVIHR